MFIELEILKKESYSPSLLISFKEAFFSTTKYFTTSRLPLYSAERVKAVLKYEVKESDIKLFLSNFIIIYLP